MTEPARAMLPPPEEAFETSQAAQKYLQSWARANGYAVVLKRSVKQGRYLYFICDFGGSYRNTRKIEDEDRQRKTSSRKAGCTFEASITSRNDTWIIACRNGTHCGHEASTDTLAHPILRRFDVASREQVLELVRHNTPTRQILPLLADRDPPLVVTSKDINNLIQSHRREILQGRPPAEALLEWLEEQSWPHRKLTADLGDGLHRLEGLLFAHPRSLQLLKRFGTVMTMDATYNTNAHRLPLLHFVGLTSSNRSFTAALAFLPNETTLTYMWALNSLKEIAPEFSPDVMVTDHDAAVSAAVLNTLPESAQIVCHWHVRQNVEKFARPRLPEQAEYEQFLSDFDELRDARTLDELEEHIEALRHEWQDAHSELVEYVEHKLSAEHLWVSAYINRHPHMGTRVTSRTEGAHVTLKRFLQSRHGNLFTVTQALINHFATQNNAISSDLANDQIKVPVAICGDPFFIAVSKTVSRFALNILKTQDEIARRKIQKDRRLGTSATPVAPCTCTLPVHSGIPCHHTLRLLHELCLPVPLSSIHPQWRTEEGLAATRKPRVLDPLRPRKELAGVAVTQNGRIMTGNEAAQAQHVKAKRRCKNCHQLGYNSNKCPLPCGRCRLLSHKLNQCPQL